MSARTDPEETMKVPNFAIELVARAGTATV
jgi:hypothetical protein